MWFTVRLSLVPHSAHSALAAASIALNVGLFLETTLGAHLILPIALAVSIGFRGPWSDEAHVEMAEETSAKTVPVDGVNP